MSKDGTVKIKKIIKEILEKYRDMDKYFRDIIEGLSAEELPDEECKSFKLNEIIKQPKNDYSKLEYLKGKTGCYMFLCDGGIPVYVGIGGKEVGGRDLYERVRQQCGKGSDKKGCDTGRTLSKKIQKIDKLFAQEEKKEEITNEYSINKMKTFYLIPIIVGDVVNKKDVYNARALETILIALFDPPYNRRFKNGKNN